MFYKNGDKYEGNFASDVMDGQGTFTWSTGNEYVGGWVRNERSGTGVLRRADGSIQRGDWENGSLVRPEPEPSSHDIVPRRQVSPCGDGFSI